MSFLILEIFFELFDFAARAFGLFLLALQTHALGFEIGDDIFK